MLLTPQRYDFSSKSQLHLILSRTILVVVDTTKVRFFKQITTEVVKFGLLNPLLLTPQRYDFSSKSQQKVRKLFGGLSCCWHHKGTIFQANHNTKLGMTNIILLLLTPQKYDFSSKSQHNSSFGYVPTCCCWHHKGTIFQANHNYRQGYNLWLLVVVDTTKVRFFKQITTCTSWCRINWKLLLTPQRYDFSSKSQRYVPTYSKLKCCCWHHKGTIFQANHNKRQGGKIPNAVVVDTTKVRFFKQITTLL